MDALQKKLPYSLDAEQSVLGSILIDPECFDDIAQIIRTEDFYLDSHGKIFSLMQSYRLQSKNIDVITLINSLVSNEWLLFQSAHKAIFLFVKSASVALMADRVKDV